MSIYTLLPEEVEVSPTYLDLQYTERDLYGSSRLGTENIGEVIVSTIPIPRHINIDVSYTKKMGDKHHEVANHLGNVFEILTNKSLQVETTIGSGVLDYYSADVVSQSDYFPFGMLLANQNEHEDDYHYGFNGMEDDEEMTDGNGQSYDFGARLYNPRMGRFLSRDPYEEKYAYQSTYIFAGNKPIWGIDFNGEYLIVRENSSPEAKAPFKKVTASGLGDLYKVDIAEDGKVSITRNDVDGELTDSQQKFKDYLDIVLDEYGSDIQNTNIKLDYGSAILIGGAETGIVDMKDVEAFGMDEKVNSASVLIHELVEQYAIQVKEYEPNAAHLRPAFIAENAVVGMNRQPPRGSDLDGIYGDPVPYVDKDGNEGEAQTLVLGRRTIFYINDEETMGM